MYEGASENATITSQGLYIMVYMRGTGEFTALLPKIWEGVDHLQK